MESVEGPEYDRKRALKVFEPNGYGPVASSRHFSWIMSRAMEGEHEAKISAALEKEMHEVISPNAIRDYVLENIPPDFMRPNLELRYYLKKGEVSELDMMELCKQIGIERLMLLRSRADSTDDAYLDIVDCLRKLAKTITDIKIKTGYLEKPAKNVNVTITETAAQTTIYDEETGEPIKNITQIYQASPDGNGKPRRIPAEVKPRTAAQAFHILRKLDLLKNDLKIEAENEQHVQESLIEEPIVESSTESVSEVPIVSSDAPIETPETPETK